MRTKLLSFLLISSFVISSVPVFAQEEPVPDVPANEIPMAGTPAVPETPEAVGLPVVDDAPFVVEVTEPVTQPSPQEKQGVLPASAQEIVEQIQIATEQISSTSNAVTTDQPVVPVVADYKDIEGSIALSNNCTATDVDGVTHVFSSGPVFLAICALVEAQETGVISGFEFEDYDWGVMLTSIEGIPPGDSEFWELRKNGESATAGVQSLEVSRGDTLSFVRTNYATEEEEVFDQITIHIESVFYDVTVPSQCSATATNGTTYTFPQESSDKHFAICAIVEAYEKGMISDFAFDYYSPGAFVSKINGTTSAGPVFWALWHNDVMAEVGTEVLEVEVGDVVSLRYSDATTSWPPIELDERYDFRIAGVHSVGTGTSTDGTGGGSGGNGDSESNDGIFDFTAAYEFLANEQNADGSWDSELVTDWAAIALALSGAPADMKSALATYLRNEDVDLDTVRDYERHAMALMALNINPYTGGQEDYITPIVESFDGTQIDDPSIVNDDAFALIVLLNAGYTKDDEIIKSITAFIVSEQRSDGSWDGGVDLSGPYLQALAKVRSLPGVSTALSRAESYLRSEQSADSGFGDPFATAWAVQGIEALGGAPETWTKGDHTPLTYLADAQQEDGGLATNPSDYSTRAWATAYAIPAVKGITWDSVLKNFRKPADVSDDEDSDNEDDDSNTDAENATSTDAVTALPVLPLAETYAATTTAVTVPTEPPTTTGTAGFTAEPTSARTGETTSEERATTTESGEESSPLTASAIESGAWSWVKRMLASLWSAIAELFA